MKRKLVAALFALLLTPSLVLARTSLADLQSQIDGQQTQIDDLTSRVEVLEGGEPQPPQSFKYVFVSSWEGTGAFGGLEGADNICNHLASQAGLPGTYKAWLSDTVTSAADRLTHADVPYVLPITQYMVAANWTDLTDGAIMNPLGSKTFSTETGEIIDASGLPSSDYPNVWTNTLPDGSLNADYAGGACADWTLTTTPALYGYGGVSGGYSSGANWTHGWLKRCDEKARIYCFQQ